MHRYRYMFSTKEICSHVPHWVAKFISGPVIALFLFITPFVAAVLIPEMSPINYGDWLFSRLWVSFALIFSFIILNRARNRQWVWAWVGPLFILYLLVFMAFVYVALTSP